MGILYTDISQKVDPESVYQLRLQVIRFPRETFHMNQLSYQAFGNLCSGFKPPFTYKYHNNMKEFHHIWTAQDLEGTCRLLCNWGWLALW